MPPRTPLAALNDNLRMIGKLESAIRAELDAMADRADNEGATWNNVADAERARNGMMAVLSALSGLDDDAIREYLDDGKEDTP